jgi:protein transport protein SEC20
MGETNMSFVTVFVVSLRVNLRSANLQAKDNMRKAAQEERELLLGGGTESTVLRRKRQANAGVTSDAESITESLRRSRQLMVQVRKKLVMK